MFINDVVLFQYNHNTASRIKVSKVVGDSFRVNIERCNNLDISKREYQYIYAHLSNTRKNTYEAPSGKITRTTA